MSSIEKLVKFYCVCSIVLLAVSLYSVKRKFTTEKVFQFRNTCTLPPHPSSGWWSLTHQPTKLPKTPVPTGTILQLSCNETYKMEGSPKSICIDGKWYPEIAKCLKTCPSMFSTPLMKVRCSFDNKIMKNCENATDNTQAQFICGPFYEDERKIRLKAICNNGRWSEKIPHCVPVCGRRKSMKEVPLIINGTITTKGELPWQVALYRNRSYVCGGILLHERLILTAAHCISDIDGKPHPTHIYSVIVGNYYRRYNNASLEKNAQHSSVHAIYLLEGYAGANRMYYGDIAIIVPSKTFILSSSVQPICVDWTRQYENLLFKNAKPMGLVSGWGYNTEYSTPSEVLRSLEVPITPREKCVNMFQDLDYQEYITQDKLCAGYLNKSKSVCQGDSGSGMVFNHEGKHYIIGIVSISLRGKSENGGCDSQKFSFFTHVTKYIEDFIWEYYARYKPFRLPIERSTVTKAHIQSTTSTVVPTTSTYITPTTENTSCLLTKHPDFGQWSIYGTTTHFFPGTFVTTGTILKIVCHEGYKLDGNNMLACENGTWSSDIGTCLKICPSITSTKVMNITCYYKMGKLRNCVDAVVGTTAKYQCAPFYEDVKLMEHPLYCVNGSWSPGTPRCIPKCGHKSIKDLVFNETGSTRDFPWMVGLYKKSDNRLICTGSLLNERIVLTAAYCLGGPNSTKLFPEEYIIAAGSYLPTTNSENVQISLIHQIVKYDYLYFIEVEEGFQFSRTIQPVCIEWEGKLKHEKDEGYLSLWHSNESSTNFSHNLTTVQVSLASIEECRINLPEEYMNMTDEKLCVYHSQEGISFCGMDGGGGLFVKLKNQYYIVGVMDALSTEGCVNRKYCLYIPIYPYIKMFEMKLKV